MSLTRCIIQLCSSLFYHRRKGKKKMEIRLLSFIPDQPRVARTRIMHVVPAVWLTCMNNPVCPLTTTFSRLHQYPLQLFSHWNMSAGTSSFVDFLVPSTTSHFQSNILVSYLAIFALSPGFTLPLRRYMIWLTRSRLTNLSDPIHYVKNYKSDLYNLVALGKSKSESCNADAMRLSCSLAYMTARCTSSSENKDCTFEDFEKAVEASFEHHWNKNHKQTLWLMVPSQIVDG
jgi:hypothetical protein